MSQLAHQIESMSPKVGDLLVISVQGHLSVDQRKKAEESLKPLSERLGCELLVLEAGITVDLKPRLNELLAEQIKQTAILERIATQQTQLITALAEEGIEQDPESEPLSYMSGAPRHPV